MDGLKCFGEGENDNKEFGKHEFWRSQVPAVGVM